MSASEHDEAQRALEQRALLNVHALARRLGYADAIDRYGERFVLISAGIVVFFVVTAVAIVLAMPDDGAKRAQSQRCRTDMEIAVVDEIRADLKARNPKLTQAELERRVRVTHSDVKQEAASRCAARGL